MEKILISVVIPFYKGEKYIEEAVKSVINQPYKNIEIILINDGSPTGKDICVYLSKCYSNVIKYFEKDNEGIGATRNFGIRKSSGNYIAFLDQDDVWVNGFLDTVTVDEINCGGDIIAFSYYICNMNLTRGKLVEVKPNCFYNGGIQAVKSLWNHHSSMFFKREMLVKNEIGYALTRHEDEIFRHKCLYLSKKVTLINKPMFLYRNNLNSETHINNDIESLYSSILSSWEDTILWHNKLHNNDEEIIFFLKGLICLYAIEGIEKLYRNGINDSNIQKIICNAFYKDYLDKYTELNLSTQTFNRIDKFYNHHFIFSLKNRLIGILESIYKCFLKINYVRKFADKKKYPVIMNGTV